MSAQSRLLQAEALPDPKPSVPDARTAARVLIVEDDFLIATDVASTIRRQGMEVIGPVSDPNGALDALAREEPDFAILDVSLGQETGFAVADALLARRVPFVFATGYSESAIPSRYREVIRFEKPFLSEEIAGALSAPARHRLPQTGLHGIGNALLGRLAGRDAAALRCHLHRKRIGPDDPPPEGMVLFPENGFCSLGLKQEGSCVGVALVGRDGVIGAGFGGCGPLALAPTFFGDIDLVLIDGDRFSEILRGSASMRHVLDTYHRALAMQMAWNHLAAATLDIPRRLAHWIALAAELTGPTIRITHSDLSRVLGVRRAGVTTGLHTLEGARLIRSARNVITVSDRAGLLAYSRMGTA
jgi:CheY-like chemotaxis protein